MDINIRNFDDVFVRFSANRLSNSRTIWIRNDTSKEKYRDACDSWTKDSIKQRFAFGVPNEKHFPLSMFDPGGEAIEVLADRYGGYGLGPNGGGARTGIIGEYQVKGIGKNPLAGCSDADWHSYGGQSLIDAVLETINSEVFGHILPIGTVTCYGIILTGSNTAYMPTGDWENETGPGALLVRDLCVRPAHFFRANNFQPQRKFENMLLDDVERTRRVNIRLRSVFGEHQELIRYLGVFLSNCANQFAFAKIFRIYHGVLSPSNISFDGRWLDLTNISFVDAGVNYKERHELTSFYDEIEVPLRIVDEFIYNYTKYNRTEFNVKPLVDYYRESVSEYISYYSARFIGISGDFLGDYLTSKPYLYLVEEIKQVIAGNQKAVVAAPTGYYLEDPAASFLRHMFLAIPSADARCGSEIHEIFSEVLRRAFKSSRSTLTYTGFVTLAAIRSLKKAQFSSFFNRGRIIAQLLVQIKNAAPDVFEAYIEDHIDVARWLFESESNAVPILFRSSRLELRYDASEERYLAVTNHLAPNHFRSARDLINWVEGLDSDALFIDNYDFRPGLLKMLVVLEELEKLKDSDRDIQEHGVACV